jgi:diguanylate cyclase (GGDEF)-like protein/PAS domain S-box-containing protein
LDIDVHSFVCPQEAIDWLEHHSADLVITDFRMPDMTGDKLVAYIRSRRHDPDIPVIVITAYDDRAFRITSLAAGATDFLLSPVDHIEFVTRARNLLKLRTQQQILVQRAAILERRLESTLTTQENLLRESREALAQVIDTVPAMISAADRDGKCIFVNALQAAAAGAVPSEFVGQPVELLFGPERGVASRQLDRRVLETGRSIPTREEEIRAGDGETRLYLTSKVPLRDSLGVASSVLTTSIDITDRRNAEKRLQYMAQHDPLTGLPNRGKLREHLRQELARGRRGDRQFALHFIDLDRFKAINDAHGHHRGDEVLCDIAEALSESVNAGDIVARIGGDEFAVLQSGITGPSDAVVMAETIIARLNQTSEAQEALIVSASIGVTLAPLDGTDPDDLLKNSDQAMYAAKSIGGNTWRFFVAEMRPRADGGARLEAELRRAISRQEFVLYYQPQIDLHRRAIIGVEALLRWRRPGHGLVFPAGFLGLAEESGLIVPINEWVLTEACRQAAAWERAGISGLRVAVNLSPVQFRRQKVNSLVAAAIAETGIGPSQLDLELTESILLGDVQDVTSQLNALRELGVTLSLDDFGTGYSSLSYIRNFPLDRLKIDRSFVQGLANNQSDLAIVRTIIDLGHILGLRVLAEGVETNAQITLLEAEGCDEVQGFYFSEAIPPDTFVERLVQQRLNGLPGPLITTVR